MTSTTAVAFEGTVTTVVSGITKGMGTVGANTTKSMIKVETVTSVASSTVRLGELSLKGPTRT